MVEDRPSKHKSIEQRHGNTDFPSLLNITQHSASRRTVQIQCLANPGISGRYHKSRSFLDESHVTDNTLIEYFTNRFEIIFTTFGESVNCHPCVTRRCVGL